MSATTSKHWAEAKMPVSRKCFTATEFATFMAVVNGWLNSTLTEMVFKQWYESDDPTIPCIFILHELFDNWETYTPAQMWLCAYRDSILFIDHKQHLYKALAQHCEGKICPVPLCHLTGTYLTGNCTVPIPSTPDPVKAINRIMGKQYQKLYGSKNAKSKLLALASDPNTNWLKVYKCKNS